MAHAIVTKLPHFAGIAGLIAIAGACATPAVEAVVTDGGAPDGFTFSVPDATAIDVPGGSGSIPGGGCAFQAFAAERLPLDLLVLVDASASMGDPVAGTMRTK